MPLIAQMFPGMEWIPAIALVTCGGILCGTVSIGASLCHPKSRLGLGLGIVATAIGVVSPPLFICLTRGGVFGAAYLVLASPILPGALGSALSRLNAGPGLRLARILGILGFGAAAILLGHYWLTLEIAPIPENIAPEQRETAVRLSGLGAKIETDTHGRIVAVSFYYDNDANNPTVGDREIACLGELRNLERLNIYRTEVADSGLAVLLRLPKLKSLAAPRAVTDRGMVTIGQIKTLESLGLWCPVTDAGLSYLKNARGMETLNLSGTQITGKGLQYLSEMKRLRYLCLSSTDVANGGLESLNNLPSLRELRLDFTRVTDQDLAGIEPTLARLETLYLNSTAVTDAGVAHLRGARNLKTLWLDNTKITDGGLASLAGLTNLEELLLSHTAVTDKGVGQLGARSKLKKLSLYDTAVSARAVADLKEKLPGAEIDQKVKH